MLPSTSVAVFLRHRKPSGTDWERVWVEGASGKLGGCHLRPRTYRGACGILLYLAGARGWCLQPGAAEAGGPVHYALKRRKSGIHHCQCLGWPAPSNTAANTKHPLQMENGLRIKHRRGNNNGILTRPSRQREPAWGGTEGAAMMINPLMYACSCSHCIWGCIRQ